MAPHSFFSPDLFLFFSLRVYLLSEYTPGLVFVVTFM